MNEVYTRVADSLENIVKKIQPETIVPIGFDGAVIYHLLAYKYKNLGKPYKDQLENVVQISSKTDEIDLQKLQTILKSAGEDVYFLDLRTKTGSLGSTIKSMSSEYIARKDINCKPHYVVLFGSKADVYGDPNELSDDERRHIFWVDGRAEIARFIRKDLKGWEYRFTHEAISRLKHVPEIKEAIKPVKKKALDLYKT